MPNFNHFPLLGLELKERERESLREASSHEISSSLASPPDPASLGYELGPAMRVLAEIGDPTESRRVQVAKIPM
ncbi:hypothetical protein Taro_015750 [Colocasia esculenta]|uniref:Uncharacterized protein n=1 Tax=Colocasia esculenta TaxID=4460 RepID=A0A843UC64_COLES|nr:hypothetical protein [Colocasia esculenta]